MAIKVRELLQTLHLVRICMSSVFVSGFSLTLFQVLQKPTADSRQLLIPASRSIAQAVTDLIAFGEILKGSDWVDPTDPAVIAENELLGAANSIEAAAQKLALLKPRQSARVSSDCS